MPIIFGRVRINSDLSVYLIQVSLDRSMMRKTSYFFSKLYTSFKHLGSCIIHSLFSSLPKNNIFLGSGSDSWKNKFTRQKISNTFLYNKMLWNVTHNPCLQTKDNSFNVKNWKCFVSVNETQLSALSFPNAQHWRTSRQAQCGALGKSSCVQSEHYCHSLKNNCNDFSNVPSSTSKTYL